MIKDSKRSTLTLLAATAAIALASNNSTAIEPCGDFGECKVLIEINASDGDIGFHFLMDGDDLRRANIIDPNNRQVFADFARGPLRKQGLTETFAESAEPLCWEDPDADEDEEIVTLEEFLERWIPGTYKFKGWSDKDEIAHGETELTFDLPAAPADVDFDGMVISWSAGDDLGECADYTRLSNLVSEGILPTHPENVPVASWEVVLEPDVEPGDPADGMNLSLRVPGDVAITEVTVPADYLAALGNDVPVKVEVGAIGVDDNATFTEEDGFCANEDEGCEFEEEE